jgi:ribonuclease BN (tRNA processing enzyme)
LSKPEVILLSLQIQMLGTGSAFAKKYYNNNALVYFGGYTLLVDCGTTAPRSLFELQIPFNKIDAVLITHLHADHIGGLEELAFQLTYVYRHRMKLVVPSSISDNLWNQSLRGGLENAAEGFTKLESYFDVCIVDEEMPFELQPGFTVELLPTEHVPKKPSYSLVLNDYVYFSSDSKFDPARLNDMHGNRRCQYIFHDCQLFSPGTVHASLNELLSLPEEIQAKVLLMHYGDNKDDYIGKTGLMRFIDQHKIYDLPNT